MSGDGWRPHIESALSLDLTRMMATRAVRVGERRAGFWQWHRDGAPFASIRYESDLQATWGTLTLDYVHTGGRGERKPMRYAIQLSSIPLHFGGRRWFMHCPYSRRRACKLYLFSGLEYFCHRTAVRPLPTYYSQRVSSCDRAMAQREALRRKLGCDSRGDLIKPPRMHWRTFERYAERDDQLAERENASLFRLLKAFGFNGQ